MTTDVTDAFHVYDTTLRDGAQQEGLTLSVADKLSIARHLDDLGVGFIEGGWPGAVPKDTEFFRRARTELHLENATLAAFGATRRPGAKAADDPMVAALRDSGAAVVTLVAKSHDRHVELALRTTLPENLAMVRDTVAHLTAEGRRVFLDAEHFFDGHRSNPAYALEVLLAAVEAGADVAVLCDTNGGMLPSQLADVVADVRDRTGARLGIHCHDDTGCAVANTLTAVDAGVSHVQGTANGYGERCGNANLFTVVADLELKAGRPVLPTGRLGEMARVAHAVSALTNVAPNQHLPYVGHSAFAHKAGLHASAVRVDPMLYQHVEPESVGNDMRMLVSEMAGRASVAVKGHQLGIELSAGVVETVVVQVKDLESQGWTFEAADASFELLLRDAVAGQRLRHFTLESWRVIVENRLDGQVVSEATVKVLAKGERVVATGEGNGPVNALDRALRAALAQTYPELASLDLLDYKVRIVEGTHGTEAVTRVLVQTGDDETEWDTVGVHENVIEASWMALEDAVTFGLLRRGYDLPQGEAPPAPGATPAGQGASSGR